MKQKDKKTNEAIAMRTNLNSKKLQLEIGIAEYVKEADENALEIEMKENLELLRLSNC